MRGVEVGRNKGSGNMSFGIVIYTLNIYIRSVGHSFMQTPFNVNGIGGLFKKYSSGVKNGRPMFNANFRSVSLWSPARPAASPMKNEVVKSKHQCTKKRGWLCLLSLAQDLNTCRLVYCSLFQIQATFLAWVYETSHTPGQQVFGTACLGAGMGRS